jgi:predicted secreted protein
MKKILIIFLFALLFSNFVCAEIMVNEGSDLNMKSVNTQKQKSLEFVKNCPTFVFDGMKDTLKLESYKSIDNELSQWEFKYKFDSRHAGYGNRIDKILAQVITHHEIYIIMHDTNIVSAIMDEQWDELNQKMIEKNFITFTEKDKKIKLPINSYFKIELKSNPTTGYSWTINHSNDEILVLGKSYYIPDNTNLIGSGGKTIFEFRAKSKGNLDLLFTYERPFEKNKTNTKPEEKKYKITVY